MSSFNTMQHASHCSSRTTGHTRCSNTQRSTMSLASTGVTTLFLSTGSSQPTLSTPSSPVSQSVSSLLHPLQPTLRPPHRPPHFNQQAPPHPLQDLPPPLGSHALDVMFTGPGTSKISCPDTGHWEGSDVVDPLPNNMCLYVCRPLPIHSVIQNHM